MTSFSEKLQNLGRSGALLLMAGGLALALPHTTAAEENEALDVNDESAGTTEIRRGLPTGQQDGLTREQRYYQSVISKVEPDLEGHKDRLDLYIDLYKRELIIDTNLFATNLTAEWDEGAGVVRLSGYVNYSQNHEALLLLFHYLGFEEVIDEVEVLPSEALGAEKFALVTAKTAFTYGAPEAPRETMTEALMGDPVFLLRDAGNGYYLGKSAEGYVGYIDGANIVRVDADRFTKYQQGEHAYFLRDYEAGDVVIPVGARLKVAGERTGAEGLVFQHGDGSQETAEHSEIDSVLVELPDGNEVEVSSDAVIVRKSEPHPAALEALKIAESMYGSRYVWGGKSTDGVDCSGLVQTSFRAQGINMPRDSYMQSYVGALSAERHYMEGMRAGDLLFFLGNNGRITHVAMYKGDGIYVEASRGRVRLSSFNPEDENYDESRHHSFAFAKRPLE